MWILYTYDIHDCDFPEPLASFSTQNALISARALLRVNVDDDGRCHYGDLVFNPEDMFSRYIPEWEDNKVQTFSKEMPETKAVLHAIERMGFLAVYAPKDYADKTLPNRVFIYNGNMGSTIADVDAAMALLHYEPVAEIKKRGKFKESGSPDYNYRLEVW